MRDQHDIDGLIRRFPIGDHVTGHVRSFFAAQQRAGVFVALAGAVQGFIDGEHLPGNPGQWPPAGATIDAEILRHDIRGRSHPQPVQVRLWPLDARLRNPRATHWGIDQQTWAIARTRYPVGSLVTGTVTSISPGNRWATVAFGELWGRHTWLDAAPTIGETRPYVITKALDSTHRFILAPVNDPQDRDLRRPD